MGRGNYRFQNTDEARGRDDSGNQPICKMVYVDRFDESEDDDDISREIAYSDFTSEVYTLIRTVLNPLHLAGSTDSDRSLRHGETVVWESDTLGCLFHSDDGQHAVVLYAKQDTDAEDSALQKQVDEVSEVLFHYLGITYKLRERVCGWTSKPYEKTEQPHG